ncbi:MAG: DUF504 domain-containing protein [Alphaproteobacteria bacterium]|nr:DUF504 domain-containing protein [Alphaproteobacteria bacterium]
MGARLATSREIYDRLRWDPSLNTGEVAVVFEDRVRGLRAQPLEDFVPGSPVPWSRVRRFTVGERVIWDRDARVDRLSSGEALPWLRAAEPPAPAADLEPLSPWRCSAEGWIPATLGPATHRGRLRVFTWNLLFDLYDDEPVRTEERLPAILAELRRCEADLIGLQEVTPSLLAHIVEDPVLRWRYQLSDVRGETLEPYGQLLLSRFPLRGLGLRRLSRTKRLLIASLELSGWPLQVAVLHLTSDRRGDGHALREAQARALLETLGEGDALLLGDFNFGEERRLPCLEDAGFVDLWPRMRPGDPGHSFDPAGNPLAALTSRRGAPRRLDRVWLRSEARRARPVSATLSAQERLGPAADLSPSDHYALSVDIALGRGPLPQAEADPRCALVLVPRSDGWGPIQALRAEHDRAFRRWMPHVTLLHPFLAPEQAEAALELLREVLAHQPAFELRLERMGSFPGRGRQVAWLAAESAPRGALEALRAALAALFPQCVERAEYNPHLTLGQLPAESVERTLAAWAEAWVPQRCAIEAVALLRQGEEGRYEIWHSVPLSMEAAPQPEPPAWSARVGPEEEARRAEVLELLQEAAAPALRLLPFGSEALGVPGPGSDLDLLALLPPLLAPSEYLQGLQARLQGLAEAEPTLVEARTPLLRARLMGVKVEVCAARLPEGAPPEAARRLSPLLLEAMRPVDQLAAAGRLHDEAMLAHARGMGGEAAWRAALRALRRWAAARDLVGHAFGLLGGVSWALLASWGLERAGAGAGPAEVLEQALRGLSRGAPMPFPGTPAPDALLGLPLPPHADSAGNLTPATRRLLQEEAAQALRSLGPVRAGERPWSTLFVPARPGPGLELSLADTPGAEGRLRQQIIRLIVALEPLAPRPFPTPERAAGRLRWRIGVQDGPAALEPARAFAEALGEGPGGPLELRLRS